MRGTDQRQRRRCDERAGAAAAAAAAHRLGLRPVGHGPARCLACSCRHDLQASQRAGRPGGSARADLSRLLRGADFLSMRSQHRKLTREAVSGRPTENMASYAFCAVGPAVAGADRTCKLN